jgi:hypothetical protein
MRRAILLALAALLITSPRPTVAAPLAAPAAIIYGLTGEAFRIDPGQQRRPVSLFDRLPAGAVLEVGPDARLALAFATGRRWELEAGARVTLGPADLATRSGDVRQLPTVPTLPRLLPIRERDHPGSHAGAVRIRGERIAGLYPRHGAKALAGETVLRFEPVAGAPRYRIEIQDSQGATVFRTDVEAPPVQVPAGSLHPGGTYRWTVRTLDRPGAIARGDAELVLLSEDTARAREKARQILASEGLGSLPLLAEIDSGFGLWAEAREDLRNALAGGSGDPALRNALEGIEMQPVYRQSP